MLICCLGITTNLLCLSKKSFNSRYLFVYFCHLHHCIKFFIIYFNCFCQTSHGVVFLKFSNLFVGEHGLKDFFWILGRNSCSENNVIIKFSLGASAESPYKKENLTLPHMILWNFFFREASRYISYPFITFSRNSFVKAFLLISIEQFRYPDFWINHLNKNVRKRSKRDFCDGCVTALVTAFRTIPISSSVFLFIMYIRNIHKAENLRF